MPHASFCVVESSQTPQTPRWTEDEWEMIVDEINMGKDVGDTENIAKLYKLHKLPRHTYTRLVSVISQDVDNTDPVPMPSDIELQLDVLEDECNDLRYLLQSWTGVSESISGELCFASQMGATEEIKLKAIRSSQARLTALRSGIKRTLGL